MTTTRGPWLAALAGGTLVLALAFLLAIGGRGDAPLVSWLAVIGTSVTMASALAAGAIRDGRLSRWALLAVVVVLLVPLAGFGLAILLPAETTTTSLWLGLPPRAAIILYGVGLVPVLILPACYALDFRAAEDR